MKDELTNVTFYLLALPFIFYFVGEQNLPSFASFSVNVGTTALFFSG